MGPYGGNLALTGGGLTLGSIMIGQSTLVAIAGGMIIAGAIAVRLSFRRGRAASQR